MDSLEKQNNINKNLNRFRIGPTNENEILCFKQFY